MAKRCDRCGQLNSVWAMSCGRCDNPFEVPPASPPIQHGPCGCPAGEPGVQGEPGLKVFPATGHTITNEDVQRALNCNYGPDHIDKAQLLEWLREYREESERSMYLTESPMRFDYHQGRHHCINSVIEYVQTH